MHSGLSMVESMVTPADLKRMLAKSAGNHAQKPKKQSVTPLDVAKSLYLQQQKIIDEDSSIFIDIPVFSAGEDIEENVIRVEESLLREEISFTPSPALMPQRRSSEIPKTFASLDSQELPIVREYSAGGLVFDSLGRVAIIARHSRSGHLEWCLPKGHIEKGETPQQTAVREIREETGILGEIVDSIATIDYWFTGTSQRVHKLVHHFALRYLSGEISVLGDPDHEAEEARWVDFSELNNILSYPNERKIAWLYARKSNRRSNRYENCE